MQSSIEKLLPTPEEKRDFAQKSRAPVIYDPSCDEWTLIAMFQTRFLDVAVNLPMGATSDLTSSPRLVWSVIAPHELGIEAPFGHDLLYRYGGSLPRSWFPYLRKVFTRKECDMVYRDLALYYGAPAWKTYLAYRVLRVAGWWQWWKWARQRRGVERCDGI